MRQQFHFLSFEKIKRLCFRFSAWIILLLTLFPPYERPFALSRTLNESLYAREKPKSALIFSSKSEISDAAKKGADRGKTIEKDPAEESPDVLSQNVTVQNEEKASPLDVPQAVAQESLSSGSTPSGYVSTRARMIDVLIDMRHAYDYSDYPLTIDDRQYHRIYSFHQAFAYLKSQGLQIEKYESDEPLSEEYLSRCKTLFLNLPSGDKEPFLLSELIAIKRYIEKGGSAFFIVEHTNCYFHQSRLKPLFHELDIIPQYYGICDATQNIGLGYGWIYLNKFTPNPITKNLRQIAFQTGGGVDPRNAVVWSSDQSWQDAANIPSYGEADLGYFGNFSQDEGELVGSSGAVLAKEIGLGKVVVVGDQNIFSSFFLQYLDNYRLWINSFAWLLDNPELANPQRYIEAGTKTRRIICWEELGRNAKKFGNPDSRGYYNLYAFLCRYFNVFCIANDDSELGLDSNVLLWLDASEKTSEEAVRYACKQIEEGRTLLILDPSEGIFDNENEPIVSIIRKLDNKGIRANEDNERKIDDKKGEINSRSEKIVKFSNGGKIVALHGDVSFDNSSVPAPEAKMLFSQQENLKALLEVIDRELKDKK